MSSKTGSSGSHGCALARIERLSLLEPMIRYSEKLSSSSQPALVKRCSMASLFTLLSPPTKWCTDSNTFVTSLLLGGQQCATPEAQFPRRTLLGSSLNQPAYLRPGTVKASRGE